MRRTPRERVDTLIALLEVFRAGGILTPAEAARRARQSEHAGWRYCRELARLQLLRRRPGSPRNELGQVYGRTRYEVTRLGLQPLHSLARMRRSTFSIKYPERGSRPLLVRRVEQAVFAYLHRPSKWEHEMPAWED